MLLKKVKIQPDWRCVDLGCGPRGILDLLVERTGSEGINMGMDINFPYLLFAKDHFQQGKHPNLNFLRANLTDIPIADNSFDLCHARFVYSDKACDLRFLSSMFRITKPGGVIISQESDLTTWHCNPPQPSWQRLKGILIGFFKSTGRDINAGLRTYEMFAQAGLKDVRMRKAHINLPSGHPYRAGLLQFISAVEEEIQRSGIIMKDELKKLKVEVNEIVVDPGIEIESYTIHQIWGHKPI
jgi:ubiquinone/menaquinone biosynthesis C-methylase UbiE